MKELNNFRKFIAEGQLNENVSPEALIKVYQDEIKDAKENEQDDEVPAYEKGIEMLKKGGKPEEVNDKVQGLIIKLTGERGDPIVFLNKAKKLTVQENDLHEGTWSLGSVAEMVKVMAKLEQIREMGAAKGSIELENMDTALYNVFGDDEFSDAIDAAKGTDDDDRFNNFIGDAQARARGLMDDEVEYRKERGETGMEFKPRFGLEENDKVLDEVLNEAYRNPEVPADKVLKVLQDFYVRDLMKLKRNIESSSGEPTAQPGFKAKLEDMMAKLASFGAQSLEDLEAKVKLEEEKEEVNEAPAVFAEIDQMIGYIKDQMDPDDAFNSLVSEFEAISGGTKLLHRALKNILLDNNLGEIRSAYNEEKEEK